MAKTRSQEDESEPQWFSRFREANDQRISRLEAMVADLLCRSRKGKKENPEDQICNDEELIETEHGTVKCEANANMILANLEEESMPQFQVPVSDLEHGLRIHNASSIVCEDSQYVVGCDELCDHQKSILQVSYVMEVEELSQKSTSGNGENVAHQLFGQMPLRIASKEKRRKSLKAWKFKFKPTSKRSKLMDDMFSFVEETALLKKDPKETIWDCARKGFKETMAACGKTRVDRFKLIEEIGSSATNNVQVTEWIHEEEPDFVKINDAKMEKRIVDREMSPSIANLETVTKGMIGSHVVIAYVEHNLFATMLLRVQSKKKQKKGHKSWMFRYKFDEEDQGILQSRTGWVQEVSAVICFLRRRHLHLNLDGEESELAGRKRNHDLFIRVHNKLKQQRCPKSWMFKFKTDSKSARTNHILLQEKKPNEFEQVMNHTPFPVAKFGKYKDCDALLLLRPSDERFQIKHSELLVIVLEWVDTKGGFGMDKKPLHLSLRNRVWDPGGSLVDAATPCLLSFHFTALHFIAAILSFLKNLEVKVSSKEGDLI